MAAAISRTGRARDLIAAGLRGEYILHISTLVLRETEGNIIAKAPHALDMLTYITNALPQPVTPPLASVEQAMLLVEPKDAPIVAAAALVKADYLASYDRRHLLAKRVEIEAAYDIMTATPDDILRETQP
jgi:predicted nucleic acid-binding protein